MWYLCAQLLRGIIFGVSVDFFHQLLSKVDYLLYYSALNQQLYLMTVLYAVSEWQYMYPFRLHCYVNHKMRAGLLLPMCRVLVCSPRLWAVLKMDEPLEMPCRQAVVPGTFPGHHIQQFGRGWTNYITTVWQRQQCDLLQLHTAQDIQNQFIFELLISKQVAATLTAKSGIAVATCRTTLASADYSLCIAVGREMPPPELSFPVEGSGEHAMQSLWSYGLMALYKSVYYYFLPLVV